MINLRTSQQRYREHAQQERLRAIFERRMSILLAREFRRLATYDGPLDTNISVHRSNLTRILRLVYSQVFDNFGKRVFQALRNGKDEGDDIDSILSNARNSYIADNVGRKVTQISDTSREKIQAIIDEGEQNDLSSGEIADLIQAALSEDIGDRRAMTIARTEVHGASQDSQFEAAQATGLNVVKRWVAVEDKRTREDHVDADGQVVNMDEYFQVGDDELMYAGDPSGSPEQVINCRCITVYEESDGI